MTNLSYKISSLRCWSYDGKEILREHRDELLSNAIKGEGSLANKVPIHRIVMRMLDDMTRVTIIFPPEDGRLVKPIDEVRTGVQFVPEFPVNLIFISAIGLIGGLIASRLKHQSCSNL